MLKRERMSPVDTAWLRMDTPVNLMMIVSVQLYETPLDVSRVEKDLKAHLLKFRRFRQRVVQDAAGYWWEQDPYFDLAHHLVRVKLPGGATKLELEHFVAQLAAQRLDPHKPLWQFHLIENYNGGSAMVIRIHHCIADGIALISVLLSMATKTADGQPVSLLPPPKTKVDEDGNPWRSMLTPMTKTTVKAIETAGIVSTKALSTYHDLVINPDKAVDYVKVTGQLLSDAASVATMPADSKTRFKGRPGASKVVSWCEPLPLKEVKLVSKALGASINDVLLSCVAGALRSYLLSKGEEVNGLEIRAMVPVNLRPLDQAYKLGNRFGLVPVLLPVGIGDPLERLAHVRQRMLELKEGYTPLIAMGMLAVAGVFPKFVQKGAFDFLTKKATAVMTNVPGPAEHLYMFGTKLSQIMFWVPQSGDIGMGVSILSYAGGVQFGLITDKRLTPDPEHIIDRFEPEFDKLVFATVMQGVLNEERTVTPPAEQPKAKARTTSVKTARKSARKATTKVAPLAPAAQLPAAPKPAKTSSKPSLAKAQQAVSTADLLARKTARKTTIKPAK